MARAAAHESFERDDVRVGSERSFGVVFAVVFAIVALWPLIRWHGLRLWALAMAAIFLATAVIRPGVLRPLNLGSGSRSASSCTTS